MNRQAEPNEVWEQIKKDYPGDFDGRKNGQPHVRTSLQRSRKNGLVHSLGDGLWEVNPDSPSLMKEISASPNLLDDELREAWEGDKKLYSHLRAERDPRIILEKKHSILKEQHYLKCDICQFRFDEMYGELGDKFIEVHHIKPVAYGERITELNDLIPVCSNCHRMLHRKGLISPEELNALIEKEKSEKIRLSHKKSSVPR